MRFFGGDEENQNSSLRHESFRILPRQITAKPCISSIPQGIAYHQCEALYIIKPQGMHADAWWDTAPQGLMISTTASWWYAKPTGTPKARTLASGNPYCGLDKKSTSFEVLFWWGMVDSDHRSQWQQIYSLPPLAAREIPHMELVNGVEPSTCWLQISCSAIEPHQRIFVLNGRRLSTTLLLYHNWFDLSTLFWKKLQKNFSL